MISFTFSTFSSLSIVLLHLSRFTTLLMLGWFYSAAEAGTSLIVCVFTRMHFEGVFACGCICVFVCVCSWTCVCVFADLSLYSAWLSNLFWFCLVSRTRSQLPFKGQIGAKWAALSYRGNRLNKALCLHHWISHTRSHSMLNLHWAAEIYNMVSTHLVHTHSVHKHIQTLIISH